MAGEDVDVTEAVPVELRTNRACRFCNRAPHLALRSATREGLAFLREFVGRR